MAEFIIALLSSLTIVAILIFGNMAQQADAVRDHFAHYHKSVLSTDVTTESSGRLIFGSMGNYKIVLDDVSKEVYSCDACKEGIK